MCKRLTLFFVVILVSFGCSIRYCEQTEQAKIEHMILPSVGILENGSFAGSGTIVGADGERAYVLTAKHVIVPSFPMMPAVYSVAVFYEETLKVYIVDIIYSDLRYDFAVLAFDYVAYPEVADIATDKEIGSLTVFSPLYLIGCGADTPYPYPRRGELFYKDEERMRGTTLTWYGDSGGGIFSGKTHHLVGVLSTVTIQRPFGYPVVVTHNVGYVPINLIKKRLKAARMDFVFRR